MGTNNKGRGLLVTIEGATGTGKSTLTAALHRQLRDEFKLPVLRMGGFIQHDHEPLAPITKFLGEMMKASRFIGLPWLPETAILVAEQAYNLETYVMPAFKNGAVILYENYNDALVAYQLMRGKWFGLSEVEVARILDYFVKVQYDPFNYPKPDLTLYLSAPFRCTFARLHTRDGREVSKEDKGTIKVITRNYESLFAKRRNVVRIRNDSSCDLQNVASKVAKEVASKFTKLR